MKELEISELSDRELEILRLVATGASNKEIAQKLFISPNTVKVHLRNIFEKIGVVSRTEAAIYTINHGLLGGNQGFVEQELAEVEPHTERKSEFNRRLNFVGQAIIAVLFLVVISTFVYYTYLVSTEKSSEKDRTSSSISDQLIWQYLPPLNTPRWNLASTVYDNKIYILGGFLGNELVTNIERFNSQTNSWDVISKLPRPLSDFGVEVLGGNFYIPGGLAPDGSISSDTLVYEPETSEWLQAASLPMKLSGYAMTAFEGKLYVFGGWDGALYQNIVLIYDPGLNTWTYGTPMQIRMAHLGAINMGDKIYVIGGKDDKQGQTITLEYSPKEDSGNKNPWVTKAALPYPVYKMCVTSILNKIFLVGGENDDSPQRDILEYDTFLDNWKNLDGTEFMNLHGSCAVSLGPTLYIMGGKQILGSSSPSDQFIAYQPVYTSHLPLVP